MSRHCLSCGMAIVAPVCPKCDSVIAEQSDGSVVQVDIAHHGETVREAMIKLDESLTDAQFGVARFLRVIVGSGLIREEALVHLRGAEFRGDVFDVSTTPSNRGQILVQIKP
jgi:hypothetical protein